MASDETRQRLLLLLGLALLLIAVVAVRQTAPTSAQGQPYAIPWYSMDSGGVMNSTGGSFILSGTIGQSDAGLLSGGEFTLGGGFWRGGTMWRSVYLPLVLRNYP